MPRYSVSTVPPGDAIRAAAGGRLDVPDRPIIPFIEGDGTGPDIWRASRTVFDAAVTKAYGGKRQIAWMEVFAGEKAFNRFKDWLPEETVKAFKEFVVGIKGPLTTPVGGGIRSLNVTLRQVLDLYVCLRPVRYFPGVPSPVKRPEQGNIMKFTEGAFRDWGYALAVRDYRERVVTERESWILGNREARPDISVEDNAREIDPGYDLMTPDQQTKVRRDVEAALALWPTHGGGQWKQKLLVRDAIADITLQQILTRPREFDVIATPNLNGDYLSDALAAQVGGIGIAPGGNINYATGHAIFEATHGTAPKYANQDKVNPGSVILSGELMFRHLGWDEAADAIVRGMEGAIAAKTVTYDFHRLMEGATLVKCSEFGRAIVAHM